MADLDKLSEQAKNEIALLTSIERAAVLLLLLGEEQAANIISFLSPREVQAIGTSMVAVADLSQETVDYILDEFIMTIRGQTSLGLGTMEYVSSVFNKALGEEKAATVLGRTAYRRGVEQRVRNAAVDGREIYRRNDRRRASTGYRNRDVRTRI